MLTLTATLCNNNKIPFLCTILVDSGSEQKIIYPEIVEKCCTPIFELKSPVSVSALDVSAMTSITHQIQPVSLIVSGNHREQIQVYIYLNRECSLVLCFPWLSTHNLQIN